MDSGGGLGGSGVNGYWGGRQVHGGWQSRVGGVWACASHGDGGEQGRGLLRGGRGRGADRREWGWSQGGKATVCEGGHGVTAVGVSHERKAPEKEGPGEGRFGGEGLSLNVSVYSMDRIMTM